MWLCVSATSNGTLLLCRRLIHAVLPGGGGVGSSVVLLLLELLLVLLLTVGRRVLLQLRIGACDHVITRRHQAVNHLAGKVEHVWRGVRWL